MPDPSDFGAMGAPPRGRFSGTDTIGRDLFTRLIYAYRLSLEMAIVVLAIATPIGVVVAFSPVISGRRGATA